jgi:hypothetical protein
MLSFFMSKGFWVTVATTVVVLVVVNRIGFLQSLVYGSAATPAAK